ncbi:MAG TPA: ferritin [Armatimonadota bacterium]|jgi:ferritin
MISKTMQDAINAQITREYYSSYLYLSMAAYFESESLTGFAKWMRVQVQEENAHALIFFNYICDRDGKVELGAIEKPPAAFTSALDVFEKTYEHEQKVTAWINDLADLAVSEKDHASRRLLDWFVDEQVEEEANDTTIIAALKRIGNDGNALLTLDKELGARVFALPAPLAGRA